MHEHNWVNVNGGMRGEETGKKAWFARCCGQRMFVLHFVDTYECTECGLMKREWRKRRNICLACGGLEDEIFKYPISDAL